MSEKMDPERMITEHVKPCCADHINQDDVGRISVRGQNGNETKRGGRSGNWQAKIF